MEKAVDQIESSTISDIEIYKGGGGDADDLRWYVLEKDIPFQISPRYREIINEIFIDENILEEKIKYYNAENDFRNIHPPIILKLIENKKAGRKTHKLSE